MNTKETVQAMDNKFKNKLKTIESNLTKKLLSICGDADKTYGYFDSEFIIKLTEEQRIQIEAELIKSLGFDKIVWMDLPAGLTEDGEKAIVMKTHKMSDVEESPYEGKVGYVYTISFTPKMYEPGEMYKPVKDGCVFAPTTYNPETFEPKQSITISWSPDFPQDIDTPARTLEDDKQMIRDMLEKVLNTPEEYRPLGHVGCLVRFATI
jgi:hypothetical protein